MGFKFWWESIIFIFVFGSIIAVPCFFLATIGSKMFNDLGNFPSKANEIQMSAFIKVVGVEIVAFIFLALFFHTFYSG